MDGDGERESDGRLPEIRGAQSEARNERLMEKIIGIMGR